MAQKEIVVTGKTEELALEQACGELGKTAEEVEYEVLEEAKKGLFGLGATEAKLRVWVKDTPALRAINLVETLVRNMGLDAEVNVVTESEEGITLNVVGEGLGVLIGRRGDVLDAVQYMANLSANLGRSGFFRVTLDAQGYREKRASTIRALTRRLAEKVLKYHRSFQLDPMTPYERRIAHDECQKIEGVTTHSVGEGAERRVVISLDR